MVTSTAASLVSNFDSMMYV